MWVDIPGLDGYQAHPSGRIRGPRRELSEWTDDRGCRRVKANGRPYAVHMLILTTFVGPRPDGATVRWINGDPTDNRLVNLKWWTGDEVETPVRSNRCRRNHVYTPENTRVWGSGHRICLACERGDKPVATLPDVI